MARLPQMGLDECQVPKRMLLAGIQVDGACILYQNKRRDWFDPTNLGRQTKSRHPPSRDFKDTSTISDFHRQTKITINHEYFNQFHTKQELVSPFYYLIELIQFILHVPPPFSFFHHTVHKPPLIPLSQPYNLLLAFISSILLVFSGDFLSHP